MEATPAANPARNIVVLCGTVSSEPYRRTLADGESVVHFDVRIPAHDDLGASSVPVAARPSARDEALVVEGAELLVVGSVRRRFFRAGGQTQSRTEVLAEHTIPVRRRRSIERALSALVDALVDEGGLSPGVASRDRSAASG